MSTSRMAGAMRSCPRMPGRRRVRKETIGPFIGRGIVGLELEAAPLARPTSRRIAPVAVARDPDRGRAPQDRKAGEDHREGHGLAGRERAEEDEEREHRDDRDREHPERVGQHGEDAGGTPGGAHGASVAPGGAPRHDPGMTIESRSPQDQSDVVVRAPAADADAVGREFTRAREAQREWGRSALARADALSAAAAPPGPPPPSSPPPPPPGPGTPCRP